MQKRPARFCKGGDMRKSAANIAINSVGALMVFALCAGLLPLQPLPARAQGLDPFSIFPDPPPVQADPCEGKRSWADYQKKEGDRLRQRQAENGDFSQRADAGDARARSFRAQAKQMNCDALLKGTAECLKQQKEIYRAAEREDYTAANLRDEARALRDSPKQIAAAQKNLDACLTKQREAAANPAAKSSSTPPTKPPVAPTPVAAPPPLGPPPPPNWSPVTPPAPPDTITCNYTDGTPTGRASFTTKDPQFLKSGCPPTIFPNLTLIAPPSGPVMGPLTPLSPPPLTPLPPSIGGGGGGGGGGPPLPPPTVPSSLSSDCGNALGALMAAKARLQELLRLGRNMPKSSPIQSEIFWGAADQAAITLAGAYQLRQIDRLQAAADKACGNQPGPTQTASAPPGGPSTPSAPGGAGNGSGQSDPGNNNAGNNPGSSSGAQNPGTNPGGTSQPPGNSNTASCDDARQLLADAKANYDTEQVFLRMALEQKLESEGLPKAAARIRNGTEFSKDLNGLVQSTELIPTAAGFAAGMATLLARLEKNVTDRQAAVDKACGGQQTASAPPGSQPPPPPTQSSAKCGDTVKQGGDAPESITIPVGGSSGKATLDFETYDVPDQMTVYVDGAPVTGTGCVGNDKAPGSGAGSKSFQIPPGASTIRVDVNPNCNGTSSTEWQFKLTCPKPPLQAAPMAMYELKDDSKMEGLGPPPDQPAYNPPAPGVTTTALLPPQGPIYVPIPVTPPNVCHPKPQSVPGNVCHPKPGNVCNPKASNPCNPAPPPPSAPLSLKQKPGTQVAKLRDPNSQMSVPACESKSPYLPWGGTGSATITVTGGKPCSVGWHDTGATVLDSMSVTSQPSHGSLTPRDQHQIIFTPAPGYKGTDSFMLSMQEHNRGRRATLQVKVNVTIR